MTQVADTENAFKPVEPAVHHRPQRIAPDVHVIRQLQGEGTAPFSLYINSLVITGREPVIIDTGTEANRRQWLEDVFSIVDPAEVRWIFLTHDDLDHVGNLEVALRMCPKATLVTSWLMVERMTPSYNIPWSRIRWVNDGDHFQAGDRTLVALRPPTYDSPTTRGIFDTGSGVYYASDSFGAAVPHPVDEAGDLDEAVWSEGLTGVNRLLSPWIAVADPVKFAVRVTAVRTLEATAIATCHGPVIRGRQLPVAYELMSRLPEMGAVPIPGQAELEGILASFGDAHGH